MRRSAEPIPLRSQRQVRPLPPDAGPAEILRSARVAAHVTLPELARAIGRNARTVGRWELGKTRAKKEDWARVAAAFAPWAPQTANRIARAAGVPLPVPEPAPIDPRTIERALFRVADALDVSPKRARAAVRDLVRAVHAVGGSLADLARAAEEPRDEPSS